MLLCEFVCVQMCLPSPVSPSTMYTLYYSRQGLSLKLELLFQIDLLAGQPWGSLVSTHPDATVTVTCTMPNFCVHAGKLNSGPHACKASPSPTEPSPKPLKDIFESLNKYKDNCIILTFHRNLYIFATTITIM